MTANVGSVPGLVVDVGLVPGLVVGTRLVPGLAVVPGRLQALTANAKSILGFDC